MKKKYFTEEEKKEARKLEAKKYYEKNKKQSLSDEEKQRLKKEQKEKRDKYVKEYYKKNKEKIIEYSKQYFKDNQEIKQKKNNERYNKRRQEDPVFKLSGNVRRGIIGVLKRKGFSKKCRTYEILSCSFEEFKVHLESKFENWMNWENYGKYNGTEGFGWDIDHIIPQSTAITEDDVIRLNHHTNLQPLCSKINRDIKRDNVVTVIKSGNISKINIK
jgi:hypothetical protein